MQLETTKSSIKDTESQMAKKDTQLKRAIDEQHVTRNIIKKLETELKEIKTKQKEIIEMRCNFLKKISDKNNIIKELSMKENESKVKVKEALQLVEAALIEKDAALHRELQTQGN